MEIGSERGDRRWETGDGRDWRQGTKEGRKETEENRQERVLWRHIQKNYALII